MKYTSITSTIVKIVQIIGIALIMIGLSAADSESLMSPIGLLLAGALMTVTAVKAERAINENNEEEILRELLESIGSRSGKEL